jgi:penicillin-binding protein 1A
MRLKLPFPALGPARPARGQHGLVLTSVLLVMAVIAVLLALVVAVSVAVIYPQLPPLDAVTNYRPREPLQVFTRDGVEIAQFGAERRQYLPIAAIPQRMQDAVVAVEDSRFREHSGIDFKGVARALLANLAGKRQGASTITQQVARNFFLSSRRTLERKLKEAALALKIEQQLSKDQILELYLNQIYLGQHAYGFGAAAKAYFGKPLAALSTAECAMLAGLPQNPSFANPITNLERATTRQQVVLGRMRDTGVITDAEYEAAKAEKLVIRPTLQVEVHAEHVAEMARRVVVERFGEQAYTQGVKVYTSLIAADQQAAYAALRRGLLEHERKQAWRGPEDNVDLPEEAEDAAVAQALKDFRDDEELRVAIVLKASPREVVARLASGDTIQLSGEGLRWAQPALQPKASDDLRIERGAIVRVMKADKIGWTIAQWPEAQGALVAMDPANGRVRALVGGFDFNRQPFNHVTQAWRQPGSSFKPFLYAAALEHGVQPATLVNDAPLTIGDWSPQNSDGKFDGPLTLRQALAKSKNLVSVRLVQQMGVGNARQWAGRYGFDVDKQPDNLTLALGAGSTTPLQLASAYAVLANGGYKVTPRVIERITDAQGKLLFEAPAPAPLADAAPAPADAVSATGDAASAPAVAAAPPAPGASAADGQRVVPARNVFITRALLNEVTRSGTASRAQAQLRRPDLYGKTGTTNDAVDAWFAGFQPGVVAVVWMGYDDPRSLGSRESGGGLSLPVWISYMAQALKGVPVQTYPVPDGVSEVAGDWRYSEFAEGGFVTRIGLDDPAAAEAAAASAAASAASGGGVAASAP